MPYEPDSVKFSGKRLNLPYSPKIWSMPFHLKIPVIEFCDDTHTILTYTIDGGFISGKFDGLNHNLLIRWIGINKDLIQEYFDTPGARTKKFINLIKGM